MGGNRNAYYDKVLENQGKAYRNDYVDIVGLDCSDSAATKDCKGYAVGYTDAGEWLEYTVNVGKVSKYYGQTNVASGLDGAGFILFVDGKAVTDTIKIPKGEDWTTYAVTEFETAKIAAAEHVLKLQFTGAYGNVDWIKLCGESDCKDVDPVDSTTAIYGGALDNRGEYATNGPAAGELRVRLNRNKTYIERGGKKFDLLGNRIH